MNHAKAYLVGSGCLWEACSQRLRKKLGRDTGVKLVELQGDLSRLPLSLNRGTMSSGENQIAVTEVTEEEWNQLRSFRIPRRLERWISSDPQLRIVALKDDIAHIIRVSSEATVCTSVDELATLIVNLSADSDSSSDNA